MLQDLVTVDLSITPSFCNAWPELLITANGEKVWQDLVQSQSTITVRFPAQDTNLVRITYLNKQNGPDVWDTQIDADGRIIQDQNAVLTTIRINGARCDWILDSLMWNYLDGRQQPNRGFMDLQGHADIEFPRDVYAWIIEQRQARTRKTNKTSALDYKSIYIPTHVNQASLEVIEEIKQMVNKLHV
jgi:hypothetical protein